MDLNPFTAAKNAVDMMDKAISEHGSAAILRDHLALVREKLQVALKENEDLKKENAKLVDVCRAMEKELKAKAVPTDYVEHRGALFKRAPAGGYEKAVYCPDCKKSTASFHGIMPYKCSRCPWTADFAGEQLAKVMAELSST